MTEAGGTIFKIHFMWECQRWGDKECLNIFYLFWSGGGGGILGTCNNENIV